MDFEEFRLDTGTGARELARPRKPFFKGGIPLHWLSRAACLPGRSLHVALAVWHLCSLQKAGTIKMQQKIRAVFNLSREVYGRGLTRLEAAGLISVCRERGRTPSVTINVHQIPPGGDDL